MTSVRVISIGGANRLLVQADGDGRLRPVTDAAGEWITARAFAGDVTSFPGQVGIAARNAAIESREAYFAANAGRWTCGTQDRHGDITDELRDRNELELHRMREAIA